MHCVHMHREQISIHPFRDNVNFEFFNMLSHVWPEDGFITDRNMLVNVCMFILIQSVKKCVNWNPQNGWYIRHYELAHVTIKPVTCAVRATVLATSTEILSLWKPLSRLHSLSALSLYYPLMRVMTCLKFLKQRHLHLCVSTGCVCSSDAAQTQVRN